ncbi:MAG: tail fiber protein [Clostridia bacterium]|nr:tail fiber protein [Clostridia bacterium]MBQ7659868.1 tail fiber protein [Alphaproteobacteria bacterium]
MPFDSNGNFSRVMNWTSDYENGIEIVCDRHDDEDDNFAQGFNECFCRDGRAAATGNFKMGQNKITGLANGESTNDAINKSQLDSARTTLQAAIDAIVADMGATSYIGDIKASAQTANHGNWLLCNGQAVSRATYADLYALIGTNFGEGDGVNTFNVPDYRGKFLRGLGGDSAPDIYTTQNEGLPAVPYSRYPQNQTARFDPYASTGGNHAPNVFAFQNAQATSDIYGASEHVTPINMAVNFFIKAL